MNVVAVRTCVRCEPEAGRGHRPSAMPLRRARPHVRRGRPATGRRGCSGFSEARQSRFAREAGLKAMPCASAARRSVRSGCTGVEMRKQQGRL